MDNDYSQLEHLIQDVTSLDTARMTLRWALERLSVLERANRELDEKLIASQEGQKSSEKRMKEMEEMIASRTKLWAEQEAFYKKLEQTVNLLAEGKVDILQIARKEVELDRVRQEVSNQYKSQLEELERANREMVTRWTERLLQAESFNPDALSEIVKKYDEFRRSLDQQYQERLLGLEKAIHEREEKLRGREQELESSYQGKLQQLEHLRVELQAGLESRVRELEATHDSIRMELQRDLDAKRSHLIAESEAVKESIHRDFQERTQAWQKETTRREEDILRAWDAERLQLTQESRDLNQRLRAASQKIGELEQILAASDVKHQEELLRHVADAEYNFQQKVKEMEDLQAVNRQAMETRTRQMEEEFAARREELEKFFQNRIAVGQEELSREHKSLQLQRKLVLEELARTDERFKQSQADVAAMREEMERRKSAWEKETEELLATHEKSGQERLAAIEAKQQDRIKELETFWSQEKQRLLKDLSVRDSALAKAHADILALREKMNQELQAQLERRDQEEAQKRQALEAGWQAERNWFFKELAGRDAAMEQFHRQMETSQQALNQSTVEAWAALEALRAKLHQEFQGVLRANEAVGEEHRQALETQWAQERQKLLAEIQAAEAQADEKLQFLESQWTEQRRQLYEAVEKTGLDAEARRKELEARWRAERETLLKENQKDQQALEAQLKAREAEWERQRQQLAHEMEELKKREEARLQEAQSQWRNESQRLLGEVQKRDSALGQLGDELKKTQDALVESSMKAQLAADELRTQLVQEFQKNLEARGKEEEDRRAALESSWRSEKVRLLEEVSRIEDQFKKAQDEILALRETMDKQRKTLELERVQLKDFLEAGHRHAVEQSQAKHEERFRSLQSEWSKEKEGYLKELQMRDASLKDLADQLHHARGELAQSAVEANKKLDALRMQLEHQLQQTMQVRETQEADRRRIMDSEWRAERERLLQEMLLKEQELQRAQNVKEAWQAERLQIIEEAALREQQLSRSEEELSRLKAALAKQRDVLQTELEGSWRMERERLVKELETRQQSLQELTRHLETSRGALIEAQTHAQLQLTGAVKEAEDRAAKMKEEFEAKIAALESAARKQREKLVADFEEEYQQKKDMLLTACEQYRKELEERERVINEWEDQHEQGK